MFKVNPFTSKFDYFEQSTGGSSDSTGINPIGAVVAWLKSYTNTPTLAAQGRTEYIECNGQTLSDAASVYNGQVIPDINGNLSEVNRFLRGKTVSGGTGGSTSSAVTASVSFGAISIGISGSTSVHGASLTVTGPNQTGTGYANLSTTLEVSTETGYASSSGTVSTTVDSNNANLSTSTVSADNNGIGSTVQVIQSITDNNHNHNSSGTVTISDSGHTHTVDKALTVQDNGHTHSIDSITVDDAGHTHGISLGTSAVTISGSISNVVQTTPPYYDVVYIMRIK